MSMQTNLWCYSMLWVCCAKHHNKLSQYCKNCVSSTLYNI